LTVLPGKKYTPEDFLQMALRQKWLIVIPFVLISTGTAIYAHFLPNKFRAQTSMLVVPQRVSEAYVRSTVTSKMEDRLRTISQQILSRARLEQVIQEFNLYPDYRRTTTMEDVVERMRKDIELQPVRGDAFWVAYLSDNPRTAMKVADRLASMFIEENLKDREVLAEGTDQFLEAQLDDARRRLIEHEKKLESYRGRYMGELPSQLTSNLQVIQNTQMQLQSLAESLSRDRDRRMSSERAMADLQAQSSTASPAPAVSGELISLTSVGAPAQLEEARKALVGMQTRLKPAHPDILAVKRLIGDLEKKAASEAVSPGGTPTASLTPQQVAQQTRVAQLKADLDNIDRDIAHKQAEEERLRGVIAEYQRRAEAAPARESDLVELMRDYETLQKIYSSLLAKKEESKISANLERRQIGEQFKILDPARLPESPYSPNRARIDFIGALLGLAVGFGLATLLEYRDSSFRSEHDIVSCLALPVLAVVPRVTTIAETRIRGRRRLVAGALAAAATIVTGIAVVAWRFVLR
jgi:polysaccharide chain length determinant protein (PEP-CTERM system associated)